MNAKAAKTFQAIMRAQSLLMNLTTRQTLEQHFPDQTARSSVYGEIAERELHDIASLMGFRLVPANATTEERLAS